MKIKETSLDGVLIIQPNVFKDERGYFFEPFNEQSFKKYVKKYNFVQDNQSVSKKRVLRGLHFQKKYPQGKLVRCSKGSVFDVVVDIDFKSKTFGKYFSIVLSEENNNLLWIPPGYAHGFQALSDYACFQYKCTDYYYPDDQGGIVWNDTDLDIQWPIAKPLVSEKDKLNPSLKEYLSLA